VISLQNGGYFISASKNGIWSFINNKHDLYKHDNYQKIIYLLNELGIKK
jgi:hypothetical protein